MRLAGLQEVLDFLISLLAVPMSKLYFVDPQRLVRRMGDCFHHDQLSDEKLT